MSRVVVAAMALALFLCAPGRAQRGTHGGGWGMRGFSGRAAMGHAAPRMGFAGTHQRPFFGARPAIMSPPSSGFMPQRRTVITFGHINGGPSFRTRGFGRRFDRHFDDFHRFHHRRSFLFAYPYYGAYWPPYYGDYSDPYYSFGSYSYDRAIDTSSYTDLSNQMSQLDAEVHELRDENDSLRSTLDQQRRPAAPAASIESSSRNEPPTVIVYRDGHSSEVQNYAIVGSTLWLLSGTVARKVPLAELDIDQTVKANEDRGLIFPVPDKRQYTR